MEEVQKPARKIRKLLKKMPAEPAPKQIHDFRTNSRRVEATLHAFRLDAARNGRRVLKPLSRLRKRAGKVRDMDVLTSYATAVPHDSAEQDCAVQLLEHLGAQRRKYAKKFREASRQEAAKLRKRLKRTQQKLAKREARNQNGGVRNSDVPTSALRAGSELASPARLNHSNLHPFRLKVKEFRNVLRLAEAPDQDLLDALGETKDRIGEWHDWEELSAIAEDVLDHGAHCGLIRELKAITRKKYEAALARAERLRKHSLHVNRNKSRTSRNLKPPEPVVAAALKLVS